MRQTRRSVNFLFAAAYWGLVANCFAAASADLLKAKAEAESKGYIFATRHDEVVARAQKEGKMRALSSLPAVAIKAMAEAFRKKYPFLDVYAEEIDGNEAHQRFILEMKAGRAQQWDVNAVQNAFYSDYPPLQKKFDILGMAEHRVLNIPAEIVDPFDRNIVASASNIQVVAYNKRLISAERVPKTWEDFLRPEFKGEKFVADIRPAVLSVLVPAWGLARAVDFARKIAAQRPVWARGYTRVLTAMVGGEYPLALGPNFGAVKRAQDRDPTKSLEYKILEPVPVRLGGTDAVTARAAHPYAALLWLEFHGSPEGQSLIDKYWPYGASVFVPGSSQDQETRGKKLSVMGWEHFTKIQEYEKKLIEAYGFPTESKKTP
jgi:iron(III) transport system substrate-binding protein